MLKVQKNSEREAVSSPTAIRFNQLIERSHLNQKEIATRLGYTKPNIITMFKQGITKIPITKIPDIAAIFRVDPAELLELAMNEYEPEKYAAIKSIIGEPMEAYEIELLAFIKDKVGKTNLKARFPHYKKLILKVLSEDG